MSIELQTDASPWLRTRDDYLAILSDGQMESFGDYDNSDAFFSLLRDGLAELDPNKGTSVWTSMVQRVWLRLTEKGHAEFLRRRR